MPKTIQQQKGRLQRTLAAFLTEKKNFFGISSNINKIKIWKNGEIDQLVNNI